jgi:hypothetical protein
MTAPNIYLELLDIIPLPEATLKIGLLGVMSRSIKYLSYLP